MVTVVRWVVLNLCRTIGERRLVLRLVQALRWAETIEEEQARKHEIAQIQSGASKIAYERGGIWLWTSSLIASMAINAPVILAFVCALLFIGPIIAASYLVALLIVKFL